MFKKRIFRLLINQMIEFFMRKEEEEAEFNFAIILCLEEIWKMCLKLFAFFNKSFRKKRVLKTKNKWRNFEKCLKSDFHQSLF